MAFCTKCGAQVPDGSVFCTSCGNPIAATPAPVPEQPAPAAPEQPAAAPIPAPAPQQSYQYQQGAPNQQQYAQGQQYQQSYQQAAPGQQQQQQYQQAAPKVDEFDHTSEFDPKDISDNKVFAMATYLFSVLGIIIALIASRESKYALFHVRQSMKLQCTAVICSFLMIIPILGWIAGFIGIAIVEVLNIIAFFQVCGGKAKEPAIVRGFGFLK
ncbi:MAG: zinc-ribbon domain-containing protein [Ruminiclostridium sp.]|nr:zinc-ribbon domain-containing protein [Ruminiclostridium sp.]